MRGDAIRRIKSTMVAIDGYPGYPAVQELISQNGVVGCHKRARLHQNEIGERQNPSSLPGVLDSIFSSSR